VLTYFPLIVLQAFSSFSFNKAGTRQLLERSLASPVVGLMGLATLGLSSLAVLTSRIGLASSLQQDRL
jgi:hypothetical protein